MGIAVVGPDNKTLFLWRHTSGQWSVWRLNSLGTAESSIGLGPFDGWEITGAVVDSSNNLQLLWTRNTGEISIWKLDSNLSFVSSANYGPY